MPKDNLDDEDIYAEEGMEDAIDSDEIDEVEQGFMKGYKERDMAKCSQCGRVLDDEDDIVEMEIDGKLKRFCSDRCADKFQERDEEEEEEE